MTDYYKALGVSRDASHDEIKKAFRKLAMKFHPDRHVLASPVQRAAAGQRFKELAEAYEVLSDEKKRALYNQEARRGYGPDISSASRRYGPYGASHEARGTSYGHRQAYTGRAPTSGVGSAGFWGVTRTALLLHVVILG